MTERAKITCTILGSFKFKPQIDLAIEEFTDLGVTVLAPEKGQVYATPSRRLILSTDNFRPLPSEVNLSLKTVEDNFLRAINHSNFGYIVDVDGYVGQVVSLEMGFALARGISLYSLYPINRRLDHDPLWQNEMSKIPVLSPSAALTDFKRRNIRTEKLATSIR